ncbi:MAG: ABC transporter substrate-binding protein [Burkholderiaceae bacterium]
MSTVAQEAKVPHFAFAPIPLPEGKSHYSFVMPQSVDLMAAAVVKDIKARKFKRIGVIGFSDPWGELWLAALKKGFEGSDIKVVASETYGRADTSVTGQVLAGSRPSRMRSSLPGPAPGQPCRKRRWPSATTRARSTSRTERARPRSCALPVNRPKA